MRWGSRLPFVLVVLFTPSVALAQRSRAESLSARLDGLPADTPPWWEAALGRIEAELHFDVRRACDHAREAVQVADGAQTAGALEAARAVAALAEAMLEGPDAADRVVEEVGEIPQNAPPALRAHAFLDLSRRLCLGREPGRELATSLDALDASDHCEDVSLRLAVLLQGIHTTSDSPEGLGEILRARVREFEADPAFASFRPSWLLVEYERLQRDSTLSECAARLDEAERAAQETGDELVLGRIQWHRADLAVANSRNDEAFEFLEEAVRIFERVGSRRDVAYSLEIGADLATVHGDHELAADYLDRAQAEIEDRGLAAREEGLLRSRLGLAIARGDQAAILALTGPYNEMVQEEEGRLARYVSMRDRLLAEERRRLEAEEAIESEKVRSAEHLAALRRWVLLGSTLALGVGAVLAFASRRRLLRTNARLEQERDRAEHEERSRQALEERMRVLEHAESLGLVASGIAHDFNNLMAVVLGQADLLLEKATAPEQRRALEAIAAAGERGARLCRQLQTFADRGPVEREPLDLGEVLVRFEPVLGSASGAQAEVVCTTHAAPGAEGDRTQIEQAVLNLVANARDASARRIEVESRCFTLTAEDLAAARFRGEVRPGEFVGIEVRDDGDGMREEILERIFDPFYSTRFPGRGLGLAGVLGVVRRHGGMVSVTSEEGRGSCFRILLPRSVPAETASPARTPAAARAKARAERPSCESLDVVVIDDEKALRDFLRTALTARGHRVHAYGDAEFLAPGNQPQVDRILASDRVVVLLDLTMPTTDGDTIARMLRARIPGLPIVLMSGQSDVQLAETVAELGLSAGLAKPFSLDPLERALAEAVASASCSEARR